MSTKHLLAKALAALYVALACFVIGSAAYVWRLKCEGFGCMGVGFAWFGWAVLFAVVAGIGLLALALARRIERARRAVRWVMIVQLALGAIVLAAWVVKRVA